MAGDKPYGKAEIIQAVMDAAIPMIADRGVHAVSLRDIAAAANVNQALIIRHFGSKEEMVSQIGDYLGDITLRKAQRSALAMEETWKNLSTEQDVQLRAMARILLDLDPQKNPKSAAAIMQETREWFQRELQISPEHSFDAGLAVYVTACLVLGSEVIGPHIPAILNIQKDEALKLKLEAFQLLLKALTDKGRNHRNT